MKRMMSVLFLAGAAAGCSISKDGIGVKHDPPTATKVAEARHQLERNASAGSGSETASPAATPSATEPGLVVIGTTGPLRVIEQKDRAAFYAAYVKAAEQWHPGEPGRMDASAFESAATHWATIQIAGIPGLIAWRLPVLVPSTLAHDAQFASAAGSFMFGTTGDLVIAKSDHDGLVWMQKVLCKDDNTYHTCAQPYRAGIFDANTVQELDKNKKPKAKGAVLDPATYMLKSPQ
jgi:hypothetical protein